MKKKKKKRTAQNQKKAKIHLKQMIKLSIDTGLNMLEPEQNILQLELNLETFFEYFLYMH